MMNIYHFHTFPGTFWVIYPENTELFQAWTSYRVMGLISGIYIKNQNQDIMSFFVSAVKHLWSSNSGFLQIESLFIYSFFFFFFLVFSKYKVEEIFLKIVLRNHAIFWAIFGLQVRFDSQFELLEQLKKLAFSLEIW